MKLYQNIMEYNQDIVCVYIIIFGIVFLKDANVNFSNNKCGISNYFDTLEFKI